MLFPDCAALHPGYTTAALGERIDRNVTE